MAVSPELERGLTALAGGSHRVVACARLGEQRLIKLRLDGAGAVVLLLRWAPTGDGWRVVALEPVSASAPSPA
jgi:hypothetical protein